MIIRDLINKIYPEGVLESSLEICRDNKLMNQKLSEIWNSGKVGDEFYKDNYLYSAHLLHQLPLDLPASLINIAAHNRYSYIYDIASLFRYTHKNVLDFGSGIGNFGFTFAHFGYNVTFADVDSPHLRIVKALSNEMKVRASFANQFGHTVPATQLSFTKYDIIVCIQVLEHSSNPEELLSRFYKMLSDNGLLILETFFDDCQGTTPYHYKENMNKGYNKPEYWKQVLITHGFHPIMNGNQQEWRLLIKL
ncbi:hypothetical protein LCGC14_0512140 [marine sediment metagenome]|uniref:Methyltransferase domain-containing protein n=1 Tax=marine sediment metagenome TaxID=412755 RepID=A0A0F9SJF4_9ZZZZ